MVEVDSSQELTAEEIRLAVQERIDAEAVKYSDQEEPPVITSKFVRDCLNANEVGDGILYNVLHRGQFVFCESMDVWLKWQGHSWAIDELHSAKAAVENVVKVYSDESQKIYDEIQTLSFQDDKDKIKKLSTIRAAFNARMSGLRSMRRRDNCLKASHTCDNPLSISGREIDQKPWLLPCANGVIDLKTGKLLPGRQEDYLMHASPTEFHGIDVDRSAWENALMEIFEEDELTIKCLQRIMGMALVGEVIEHVFISLIGPGGRNGKGTIIETIGSVLGPLAAPIRSEMLIDTYQQEAANGSTPQIMSLRGLRFAWASETKEGAKLSTQKVKWMTGGDTLKGRNPHDKFEVTFRPTHTLFMLSNFRPQLDVNDKAFLERMLNIPFNVRFLKNKEPKLPNERRADLFLKHKLMEQASGILGWLVEGCLMWQLEGIRPSPKMLQEAQDYIAEEDNFAAFLDYCCDQHESFSIGATELFSAFEKWWMKYVNRFPWKQKKFGKQMGEKFPSSKTGGIYRYYGLQLNDEWRRVMENMR